ADGCVNPHAAPIEGLEKVEQYLCHLLLALRATHTAEGMVPLLRKALQAPVQSRTKTLPHPVALVTARITALTSTTATEGEAEEEGAATSFADALASALCTEIDTACTLARESARGSATDRVNCRPAVSDPLSRICGILSAAVSPSVSVSLAQACLTLLEMPCPKHPVALLRSASLCVSNCASAPMFADSKSLTALSVCGANLLVCMADSSPHLVIPELLAESSRVVSAYTQAHSEGEREREMVARVYRAAFGAGLKHSAQQVRRFALNEIALLHSVADTKIEGLLSARFVQDYLLVSIQEHSIGVPAHVAECREAFERREMFRQFPESGSVLDESEPEGVYEGMRTTSAFVESIVSGVRKRVNKAPHDPCSVGGGADRTAPCLDDLHSKTLDRLIRDVTKCIIAQSLKVFDAAVSLGSKTFSPALCFFGSERALLLSLSASLYLSMTPEGLYEAMSGPDGEAGPVWIHERQVLVGTLSLSMLSCGSASDAQLDYQSLLHSASRVMSVPKPPFSASDRVYVVSMYCATLVKSMSTHLALGGEVVPMLLESLGMLPVPACALVLRELRRSLLTAPEHIKGVDVSHAALMAAILGSLSLDTQSPLELSVLAALSPSPIPIPISPTNDTFQTLVSAVGYGVPETLGDRVRQGVMMALKGVEGCPLSIVSHVHQMSSLTDTDIEGLDECVSSASLGSVEQRAALTLVCALNGQERHVNFAKEQIPALLPLLDPSQPLPMLLVGKALRHLGTLPSPLPPLPMPKTLEEAIPVFTLCVSLCLACATVDARDGSNLCVAYVEKALAIGVKYKRRFASTLRRGVGEILGSRDFLLAATRSETVRASYVSLCTSALSDAVNHLSSVHPSLMPVLETLSAMRQSEAEECLPTVLPLVLSCIFMTVDTESGLPPAPMLAGAVQSLDEASLVGPAEAPILSTYALRLKAVSALHRIVSNAPPSVASSVFVMGVDIMNARDTAASGALSPLSASCPVGIFNTVCPQAIMQPDKKASTWGAPARGLQHIQRCMRMVVSHATPTPALGAALSSLFGSLVGTGWARETRETVEQTIAAALLRYPDPHAALYTLFKEGNVGHALGAGGTPYAQASCVIAGLVTFQTVVLKGQDAMSTVDLVRLISPALLAGTHSVRPAAFAVVLQLHEAAVAQEAANPTVGGGMTKPERWLQAVGLSPEMVQTMDMHFRVTSAQAKFRELFRVMTPAEGMQHACLPDPNAAYTVSVSDLYHSADKGGVAAFKTAAALGKAYDLLGELRNRELEVVAAAAKAANVEREALLRQKIEKDREREVNVLVAPESPPAQRPAEGEGEREREREAVPEKEGDTEMVVRQRKIMVEAPTEKAAAEMLAVSTPETDETSSTKECIVCASLLDKPPNLGGLARSAEIFGMSSLVLPSLSVTGDPVFKALSVSAHLHVPLQAVPPSDLRPWLRQKQREGYALVALEQCETSVSLESASLPARCVIVLGNEREGAPDDILGMCDLHVEIPQLGCIRSLNVHTAAVLLEWRWISQHKL
ncbi:hypothetical protein KIPB_004361, partial [Kipferlia bialata]